MVHKDAWDAAEALLRFLHVNPDRHHYAQVFLNLADNVTDAKLWAVAAGAAAYSVVRFVEAYGLWLAADLGGVVRADLGGPLCTFRSL